jgi:hypothetical protein
MSFALLIETERKRRYMFLVTVRVYFNYGLRYSLF